MSMVEGLYAGQLQAFGPRGKPSGIYKTLQQQVDVDGEGIIGDHQGDRKVHGGPEKALHQYAQGSYVKLAEAFPAVADKLIFGAMGENISSPELHEGNVCIGDIYRIGSVLVQVNQPRMPCWKIAHKFSADGMDKFVGEQAITGWYYRVLENGSISVGDSIELQQRPNPDISIHQFMQVVNRTVSEPEIIKRIIEAQGLCSDWVPRLQKRIN